MARRCQKCNTDLQGRAKFCRKCGTPALYRCQVCKTVMEVRSKFCRMCGTPTPNQSSDQWQKVIKGASEEALIPATEQIAFPALSVKQKSDELLSVKQPSEGLEASRSYPSGTAKTELAPELVPLAGRFLISEQSDPSQPIAPATHALVGIYEQAGFALRFGAFMFDLLPLMILLFVSGLLASQFLAYGALIQYSSLGLAVLFLVFNFIILAGRTGQTVGKRLIGIRIITVDQRRATTKQIVMRHILGYPLSMAFFTLGFLWLLWDRRQQGWHDKLAKTLVVRKRLNW